MRFFIFFQSTVIGDIGVSLQLVREHVGVEQEQVVVNVITQALQMEVQIVWDQLFMNKNVTNIHAQV